MSLTPGLLHRTGGGQHHYRTYSPGHELGQSIFQGQSKTTAEKDAEGLAVKQHDALQKLNETAQAHLHETKKITNNQLGGGGGAVGIG